MLNEYIFANGCKCLKAIEDPTTGQAKLLGLQGWIDFFELNVLLVNNGYKLIK